MDLYEETLETQLIHQGKITDYLIKTVKLANGQTSSREIVRHDNACGVLALTARDKALFVKQFRKAIEQELYEIPAGLVESQEEPLETAQKELLEETGYRAEQWSRIAEFYTSAGFCDEYMTVFLAQNLEKQSSILDLDPDENLQLEELSYSQAMAKYQKGQMADAKTVVALMHWKDMLS